MRIGLDWEWLQPRPGVVDGDAAELYAGLAATATELGLALQVTLLDRHVPWWFDNEGGFADARFAGHWWPRWVETVAELLGDRVAGWVPMEHPLSIANRAVPDDPQRHGEMLDTLLVAWRDAWSLLRGGPPVTTAFGVETVRAADQTVQAAAAARRLDQLRWGLWTGALRDGVVRIPGRADREIPGLAGAFDVAGLLVRHEQDTLGHIHRMAELLPDRPLAVTLLLGDHPDADRETAVQRFAEAAAEAATGVDLVAAALSPVFDADGDARGVITRDREVKDSARMFLANRDP